MDPMLADAPDPMQYTLQPCAPSLWPYENQVDDEIPEETISPMAASSMAAVATATESAKAAAKAAFMTKDEILARAARL